MGEEIYKELSIDERRKIILELLNKRGKVKVAELSRLFGISEVTIRNDLSDLEKEGLLERVHGGAITTYRAYYNMSINERARTNVEEKKKIAREAARLISDGDSIMVSSGTTPLYFIQELKQAMNITLVTNATSVAHEAGLNKNIQVILLGGSFNAQYQFTYGDDTINQLKKYRADKLVLSIDGVSADEGITTYHNLEAEVNRQMIHRSNRIIVIADHTKIGRVGFANVERLESIDTIITSTAANLEEIKEIREKGIEVRMV